MRFNARYMSRAHVIPFKGGALPVVNGYWRTIHADNVNEANKKARRYERKGYICVGITQDEGGE